MPRISLLVAFFEFLYFFMFSRISRFQKCLVLVLVCLQVFPKKPKPKGLWAILGLGTPRQDTSLSSHTNKRPSITYPLTPCHYTPPSHPTTPYLLIPRPPLATSTIHKPPFAPFTTHSHLSHGMSAQMLKLCSGSRNIPLKVVLALTEDITCVMSRLHFRVWIPNLGALPIIALVSLTHIPWVFARFSESVSYVYIFFSTCLSNCVASAAWFVFGFVFITTFLFSFFFSCTFNPYLWHGALVIRMPLLICLSSFSICMFLNLIAAYVTVYAFPSSSIFVHIYRHFHVYCLCYVLYLYPCFCVLFFFWNLIDTCVTVSINVIIPLLIS